MCKSMFRPEVRFEGSNCAFSDLVQNFHPCLGRRKSTTWLSLLNAQLLSIYTLCYVFIMACVCDPHPNYSLAPITAPSHSPAHPNYFHLTHTHTHTIKTSPHRRIARNTHTHRHRHTDTQTHTHTLTQTLTHTHTHSDTHTHTHTHTD